MIRLWKKIREMLNGKDRVSTILLGFNIFFTALSFGIIAKIIYIQFVWEPPQQSLEEFIPNYEETVIKPERGDILDCNGKILASSTPLYNIRMDCCIQKEALANGKLKVRGLKDSLTEELWREEAWKMCQQLPAILEEGRSASDYYNLIIKNRDSESLPGRRDVAFISGIDHSTIQELRQLPLFELGRNFSGMMEKKTQVRKYPYGSLARRLVGDVRYDPNDPQRNRSVGLEGQYDYILHGTEGRQWMKSTDYGKVINPDSAVVKVEHGADIRTTLDVTMQDIADKALRRHIAEDSEIEGGCAVVMEVETGAIRAMANLMKNSKGELGEYLNMAIARAGAPGSIFKTVTLTTLLEDGKVTLDTKVPTNNGELEGFPKLNKDEQMLKYIKKTGNKTITVKEGLAISSNNVFRHLVIRHYGENEETINQFTSRLFDYKLDGSYSFDLKENAYGTSRLRDKWSIPDLYSTAIGYSIRQTPLSILTFYNAIAGDGKMMKPYLIESYERDGAIIKKFEPEILNGSICSSETADSVTSALKMVAMEGTAKKLKGAKCEVAGKTGTAWVYLEPKDNPKKGNSFETENGEKKYQATFVGFFPADNPKYSAIVTVYTKLTKKPGYGGSNHPTKIFGEIVDHVWALNEEWGEEIEEVYKMPAMKEKFIGTRQGTAPVPDLSGMGLKDAIYALENNGYACTFEGTGHVTRQSIKPGTTGKPGQTVHIVLK